MNLGRPPVITVLGHVDHGKTSLLDRIRKANVASRELGGITQAIGAYQIDWKGHLPADASPQAMQAGKITFIDTPGHAAFSAMRARGGSVADVAILIVAADDGVMSQTKESIEHIRAAGIPYVVAINKIDLPQADILKVKTDLAEAGEYVEGYGGNVPVVEISAKTGAGIDKLLETVLLLAELEELKDMSREPTSAVVIESQLHPHKGPLATLLVKSGQLASKDDLYLGTKKLGKIRSMNLASGETTTLATPATPIAILGFEEVPQVGDIITTKETADVVKGAILGKSVSVTTLETIVKPNVIIKADVAGSLEAILGSLPETINIVSSSVGGVTESDVLMGSNNQATIVCFNVKAAGTVAKLAQIEKVEVVTFGIIYELFDFIKELSGRAGIAAAERIIGEAKVVKTFPFNHQTVYGCVVSSGKIRTGDLVGDKSRIISLRIGKDSVKEAKKDQECGLILEPVLDYKPGDTIITHIV